MFRVLLVLFLVTASPLHASRISDAMAKVSSPLFKTVAVLVCSASLCLSALNNSANAKFLRNSHFNPSMKRLEVGGGSKPSYAFFAGELTLADSGDDEIALGYLHGTVTVDRDALHLERFKSYLLYNTFRDPSTQETEPPAQAIINKEAIIKSSALGFDSYDFRSASNSSDGGGFAARHLHLFGWENILGASNVGLGDLGFVKLSAFEHAGLEEWAGAGADLSYMFFIEISLQLPIYPWRDLSKLETIPAIPSASDALPLFIGVRVEGLRTLFGDIDFVDGTDGSFGAGRNNVAADIKFRLLNDDSIDGGLNLNTELLFYWMGIDAEADSGRTYKQRTNGKRITFKLEKPFN